MSGQGVARPEAEARPTREVTVATTELKAMLDGDGGEMGVGYQPRRRLRGKERVEQVKVSRARVRYPNARTREPRAYDGEAPVDG